jgi:hypothetical protein
MARQSSNGASLETEDTNDLDVDIFSLGLVIHGPPPVHESYSTMPLRDGGVGRTEILPAVDFSKENPTKLTADSSVFNVQSIGDSKILKIIH